MPSKLSGAAAHWQRWLFARGDLRNLALFRVAWAVAMWLAAQTEIEAPALYSNAQYHVPIVPWASPLDPAALGRLIHVSELGGALVCVGLLPRLGTALVLGTLGYLFLLDVLLFRNHVYLGLLMGGLLCVSPAGRALSLQTWLVRRWGWAVDTHGSLLAAQLIKAQVLIVYGYSVVNKLRPSFLDGFTLQQELPFALRTSPLRPFLFDARGQLSPSFDALIHNNAAMAMCAWAVVAAEAFLTLGLPLRQLRRQAFAVGLALHGSIFLLMNIRVFGLLMVSSYLLFLDPAERGGSTVDLQGA